MNFFLVPFYKYYDHFLVIGIINTLSNSHNNSVRDFLISSELFFLTGLCLFYYFESIYKKTNFRIKIKPFFLDRTGLFFYSINNCSFFYDYRRNHEIE